MTQVARHGYLASLSQAAIKVASPGVPDYYQGSELWDFSLVDPDNRRPVDYGSRTALLAQLEKAPPAAKELLENVCAIAMRRDERTVIAVAPPLSPASLFELSVQRAGAGSRAALP